MLPTNFTFRAAIRTARVAPITCRRQRCDATALGVLVRYINYQRKKHHVSFNQLVLIYNLKPQLSVYLC